MTTADQYRRKLAIRYACVSELAGWHTHNPCWYTDRCPTEVAWQRSVATISPVAGLEPEVDGVRSFLAAWEITKGP